MTLATGETLVYRRTLDWRRGLLVSEWRQRAPAGGTLVLRSVRFVSLHERGLGVQVGQIEIDSSAPVTLQTWIEPPDEGLELVKRTLAGTTWRTGRGAHQLAMATSGRLEIESGTPQKRSADGTLAERWSWSSSPGRAATFSRIVAMARGDPREDIMAATEDVLPGPRRRGLPRLLAAHERAWADRWRASDVVVEGDATAQLALRFAIYHLISAANPPTSGSRSAPER